MSYSYRMRPPWRVCEAGAAWGRRLVVGCRTCRTGWVSDVVRVSRSCCRCWAYRWRGCGFGAPKCNLGGLRLAAVRTVRRRVADCTPYAGSTYGREIAGAVQGMARGALRHQRQVRGREGREVARARSHDGWGDVARWYIHGVPRTGVQVLHAKLRSGKLVH